MLDDEPALSQEESCPAGACQRAGCGWPATTAIPGPTQAGGGDGGVCSSPVALGDVVPPCCRPQYADCTGPFLSACVTEVRFYGFGRL